MLVGWHLNRGSAFTTAQKDKRDIAKQVLSGPKVSAWLAIPHLIMMQNSRSGIELLPFGDKQNIF